MTITTNLQEKLLIVGCGDIGQRLAQRLDPCRYAVTGLRRHPPAGAPFLAYLAGDATNASDLDAVIEHKKFCVIIITITPAERSDSGYERAYVQTCRNLVSSLRRHRHQPRLLVFVSSTAVYGQNDGSWIDEQSITAPDNFSGKRLLEAEQVIRDSGLAHCILRFSGIYGPGRNRLIEQVRNKRASASTHYTNRIHADDCASALAHLVELQRREPLADIYLATDSEPAPMVEVVRWIAAQLKIDDFLSPEAVNERGNKRVSNRRLLATGYQLRYPHFRCGYRTLLD